MIEAVRPATAADLGEAVRLLGMQREEQGGDRGADLWALREARALPLDRSVAADLADPDAVVLVATLDDVVAGVAAARVEPLTDGTTLGRVVDLYVEPGARAVGLGEALAEAVVRWCDERGCRGVDAAVLPGAREAKNLFERLGFTARSITVHRRSGT